MVYYFVIGEDGNRYGPADIDSLVEWVREGRIVGTTRLIERGTERELTADSITAIVAELRRQSGGEQPVTIERAESPEQPTMTHPGARPLTPPQGQSPVAGPPPVPPTVPSKGEQLSHRSKLVAGLLGIFVGSFGVHRFYLGYTSIGVVQLVLTLLTCGITGIWGFVEGIIILTGGMPDADGLELRD